VARRIIDLMRPAPGDIVYAFRKSKSPSRWFLSFRFGVQWPVLRLNPLSVTDDRGNDWIFVLPVPYSWGTRLNPRNVVAIPVLDCVSHKKTLPASMLASICRVLDGADPRYSWIGEDAEYPDEKYPTMRQVLGIYR
jgi:hypothetical protein